MGYFSNGSEGRFYQEKWCFQCAHWPENADDRKCAILTMHQLYNNEQSNKNFNGKLIKRFLEMFIPRDKNGDNEKCLMFVQRYGELPGQKHFEL